MDNIGLKRGYLEIMDYRDDRNSYTLGKGDYIMEVTKKAFEEEEK